LTLPIHISLVTYLCLHKKKPKQTNKNSAKIHILHQDLNPRHRDDTLSDFNNYIKCYIIMSASHEFTIFVFSIYWKGTEKLSAIHTQSLITRSCYIQTMDNSIRTLPIYPISRLVIGTSRTVGSAKKFVRITSGVGGGEFTKTLRKVCTCQKLKFSFLLLEYCKIRECYAVANAFTIRNMYSLFLYMKCNSRKINRPTKNMTKIVTLLHF
jgi:hypothetical protein